MASLSLVVPQPVPVAKYSVALAVDFVPSWQCNNESVVDEFAEFEEEFEEVMAFIDAQEFPELNELTSEEWTCMETFLDQQEQEDEEEEFQ